MNTMDSYHKDKSLPEGFREALGQNGKAVEYWCGLTEAERKRVLAQVRVLSDPGDVKAFVDGMVGREEGHPPYQL